MPQTDTAETPAEGPLDAIGVPRLLAEAWRDRRSGRLQLAHGKQERQIDVRDGAPRAIAEPRGEDAFARFLEDTARIRPADRLAVERLANERGCSQAKAVLALELLDAAALYRALRAEARARLAETFAWQAGHYRWTPPGADEDASARPHDVLALLQAELPRRWGTDRLFEALMALQDVRGDVSPRLRKVAKKLAEAGPPAAQAIAALDGQRPLGRVLGECAGDPLSAATLWTAYHSGVLRVREAAARSEGGDALDFEIEVERAAEAAVVDAAGAGASEAGPAVESPKAAAMREEIEDLRARLGDLDHYAALGLEEDASVAAIKKAYFKAAKKYHPDALARLGLGDLKGAAAEVFARIAEAFETLSDGHKRAAYDAGAGDEPEIDTARLAQAETSFRKGEILAKMGNFEGALEYLEPAVELWPDEPAYQGLLGWALFKQPRSNRERAAEHLGRAHEQAPDDAQIAMRLGVVAKAIGEAERAARLIEHAQAIDPEVES